MPTSISTPFICGVPPGIFWAEIGSGFGEPGGTPPTRIPRSIPLLPGLSVVLILTSCDVWHWRLYIRDPVRKNQSVLFTRALNGPRHSKVFTTRKLVTAGSYSNKNLAGKSAGKSFLFSTMADGFCKNALISRFESCISDVTSTNHAWVRSIFLYCLRLGSYYINQLFVAPRTATARGGHKSFTHIEHQHRGKTQCA